MKVEAESEKSAIGLSAIGYQAKLPSTLAFSQGDFVYFVVKNSAEKTRE
jgi:hypothetical protein